MKQIKLLTTAIAAASFFGATSGFAADETKLQTQEQIRISDDAAQVQDQVVDQDQERVRKMLNEDQGKGETVRNRHRKQTQEAAKTMKKQGSKRFEMDRPRSNGGFSGNGGGSGRGR